jgi:hypothetical protein
MCSYKILIIQIFFIVSIFSCSRIQKINAEGNFVQEDAIGNIDIKYDTINSIDEFTDSNLVNPIDSFIHNPFFFEINKGNLEKYYSISFNELVFKDQISESSEDKFDSYLYKFGNSYVQTAYFQPESLYLCAAKIQDSEIKLTYNIRIGMSREEFNSIFIRAKSKTSDFIKFTDQNFVSVDFNFKNQKLNNIEIYSHLPC